MWSTVISGASMKASNDDILERARLNRLEGAPFDPTIAQPDIVSQVGVLARSDSGFGYAVRTLSAITYVNSARQRWFAEHAMSVRAGWPCRSFGGERWEAERGWDRYVANPQVGANILALPKPQHERHLLSIIRPAALGKPPSASFPFAQSGPASRSTRFCTLRFFGCCSPRRLHCVAAFASSAASVWHAGILCARTAAKSVLSAG